MTEIRVKISTLNRGWFVDKWYPHCSLCGLLHNRQPTEDDALRAGIAHVRQAHPEFAHLEPRITRHGRPV